MKSLLDADCVFSTLIAENILEQNDWKNIALGTTYYFVEVWLQEKKAMMMFNVEVYNGRHVIASSSLNLFSNRFNIDFLEICKKCFI